MRDMIIKERYDKVMNMATDFEWLLNDYNEQSKQMQFIKDEMLINVYLSKMTVGLLVPHVKPTSGIHGSEGKERIQKFKKGCNFTIIEQIFSDPLNSYIDLFEERSIS